LIAASVETLFEEHAQGLFGFLAYRTGDRALAEDLVGDTFERVLRGRHRFNPRRGSEKQWIYAIALNLVRDHVRRTAAEQRATARVAAQPHAAQTLPDDIETRDELQAALRTLGEDEREVVALRFGGDLTLREIARVLGAGESAVEGRLYRALAKLRDKLAE
jgi:RNA polymerase sigma factor (sigma-70 family)